MIDTVVKYHEGTRRPSELMVWHFDDVTAFYNFVTRDSGANDFIINFSRQVINKEGSATNESNEAGFGNSGEIAGVDKSPSMNFKDFFFGQFGAVIIAAQKMFAGDVQNTGFAEVLFFSGFRVKNHNVGAGDNTADCVGMVS